MCIRFQIAALHLVKEAINPNFYMFMFMVNSESASRPSPNITYSSQYGCQYWRTLQGRPTLSPRQHLIDSSNILTLKYTLDHQASVPRCIKENILKQKAAHFPTLNLTIKQFFLAPHFKTNRNIFAAWHSYFSLLQVSGAGAGPGCPGCVIYLKNLLSTHSHQHQPL